MMIQSMTIISNEDCSPSSRICSGVASAGSIPAGNPWAVTEALVPIAEALALAARPVAPLLAAFVDDAVDDSVVEALLLLLLNTDSNSTFLAAVTCPRARPSVVICAHNDEEWHSIAEVHSILQSCQALPYSRHRLICVVHYTQCECRPCVVDQGLRLKEHNAATQCVISCRDVLPDP